MIHNGWLSLNSWTQATNNAWGLVSQIHTETPTTGLPALQKKYPKVSLRLDYLTPASI